MRGNVCQILEDSLKEKTEATSLYIKNKLEREELDSNAKETVIESSKEIHKIWEILNDLCW